MSPESKKRAPNQEKPTPEETLKKIFEAKNPIDQLRIEVKKRKGPFRFYKPLAELRNEFTKGGEEGKEVLLNLTWQYLPKLGIISEYREMGVEDEDLLQCGLLSLQEAITAKMIDGLEHTPAEVARFTGRCIRREVEQVIMRANGLTLMEFQEMNWKRMFSNSQLPYKYNPDSGTYSIGSRPAERIYPPEPKKHWGAEDFRGCMFQTLRNGKPQMEFKNCPETIELPDEWQAWINYVRVNSSGRNWGVAMIGLNDTDQWTEAYVENKSPIDDSPATLAVGSLDNTAKSKGLIHQGIEIHGHHTRWTPNEKWEDMEGKKGRRAAFTPADWYRFLIIPDCHMMVLADTLSVLMVLKTIETVGLDKSISSMPQQEFEGYWLQRHGLEILSPFQRRLSGGMMADSKDLRGMSDLRSMGLEIANNHHVAFYTGPQNGILLRCTP